MYENWCSVDEAIKRTGLSERTLYRRMKDKDHPVRSAYRRIPGRKPLLVFHPDDITRLEEQTAKPTVVDDFPVEIPAKLASLPAMTEWMAEIANSLRQIALASQSLGLESIKALTLDEAAARSGYSKAYLKRACKQGALLASKDRAWKVSPVALRQFVSAGGMAESSQKALNHAEQRQIPDNGNMVAE